MGVISVGASLGVRATHASIPSSSTPVPLVATPCVRPSSASISSSSVSTAASTRAAPSVRQKPLKKRGPGASSACAAKRRVSIEHAGSCVASSDASVSLSGSQPMTTSKTAASTRVVDVEEGVPHESVDGNSSHLQAAVNLNVRESTTLRDEAMENETRDEAMENKTRDKAMARTVESETCVFKQVENAVECVGKGSSVEQQLASERTEEQEEGEREEQMADDGGDRETLQHDARQVAGGVVVEDRWVKQAHTRQEVDEEIVTVDRDGSPWCRGSQVDETTMSPQRQLKRRRKGDCATSKAGEYENSSKFCEIGDDLTARHLSRKGDRERDSDRDTVDVAAARETEEQRLRDQRDLLRRRLARTVRISRYLEAKAKRARAHEVLERDRCLHLRRRFNELRQRKKVAELVVKKQCDAMAAALSTTPSSKKKQHALESERLNIAHNAYPSAMSRMNDSMLRDRGDQANRLHAGKLRTLDVQMPRCGTTKDDNLARLMMKLHAVGNLLTSGSLPLSGIEGSLPLSGIEDCIDTMQNVTDHEEALGSADMLECPNESPDERLNMNTLDENEIVFDAAMDVMAISSEVGSREKRNDRNDSFRSTWDLPFPGLTRDLNLIQDYSLETDCKLLCFLAGKRQYFYLEPLITGDAYSNEEKQWLLSAHDIRILFRYLSDNADFGNEVVVCAERLRAIGNLVPPHSTSPSCTPLYGEPGVFGSSRHKEWSELQSKIVNLHSLALVAHVLGKHYLSRHGVSSNRRETDVMFDNILGEDTLKSDLFTYILRPIRSSAIESSLFDSLPISLVRETIEHCPEVVNHVLQWKCKDDVPEYLRAIDSCNSSAQGARSATMGDQLHFGNSCFLRNLLLRLTACMRDLDAVVKDLVATLKEKRPSCQKDCTNYASRRRQRIVAHVNRLKSVTAHVVVENTKLQLHKWWVLFFEHSCAWFNPSNDEEMDDRSYDKFTCLQDALYIWHNKALFYSTKDDFVDCKDLMDSALGQIEGSAVDGKCDRGSGTLSYGSLRRDTDLSLNPRDEEEAALLQLTPVSLRGEVRNRPFTREEARQCIMTSRSVESARCELEESLIHSRDMMNELGHTGPWRAHVKHSNALKLELAKQSEIQRKLVMDQWARHYTKYQHFSLPLTKDGSADQRDKDTEMVASTVIQSQDKLIAKNGNDAAALTVTDWSNVYDPDKDAPDVIKVKKLRHEITLAKEQLLREIGKNRSGATLRSPFLDGSKKALFEECKGLAASCMYALDKIIGNEEAGETVVTPVKKKQLRSATKLARPEKRLSPVRKEGMTTRTSNRRHLRSSKKVSLRSSKGTSGSRSRRSESARVAKALAASNAGFLPLLTRSKSSSRVMSVRSIGGSRDQRSEGCPPLRMGCSGCRDLRRRCTGCSGCCLHCVCVSCGCRMCCSARLSSVQKTMACMLDVIESDEACKWTSNASAGNESHYCGMLFSCQQCHRCKDHCMCSLTGSTTMSTGASAAASALFSAAHCSPGLMPSGNATGTDVSSSTLSLNQQLLQNNIGAAQCRDTTLPVDDVYPNGKSTSGPGNIDGTTSTRRSAMARGYLNGSLGPLPTFDYGIDGPYGLGSLYKRGQYRTWRPAPSDKNEQEDLFRAARVRMKLVRSTFAKRMGLASASGCLDGEQLWQPERIQMMWERRDFHGVLGLPHDASVQQIKRQYRKLALKLHPDKASDTSVSLESTVAEAGRRVGSGTSGGRVDAFVAATHSYKILLGDADTVHGLG